MASRDYWEVRARRSARLSTTWNNDAMKRMESLYEDIFKELEERITSFIRRYATTEGISMAEARRLLTGRELRSFKSDVREYAKLAKDIMDKNASANYRVLLNRYATRLNVSRLEALRVDLMSYTIRLGIGEEDVFKSALGTAYEESYYHTAYDIQQFIGEGSMLGVLDTSKVDRALNTQWLGANYSSRIWNNKSEQRP